MKVKGNMQSGASQEINAAVLDTGAADAYVVALRPAISAYTTYLKIVFQAVNANTGASTLVVNGLAAKTIKKNVSSDLAAGDILANQIITVIYDGTNFQMVGSASPVNVLSISFIVDGGGSVISTGIKGDLEIPFDCTISEVTLLADQTGSIVLDIWKDTYANYPPTASESITASAKPTITTDIKSKDSTLTGWGLSISAGDTLRINVDSVSSITRCLLSLKVVKI